MNKKVASKLYFKLFQPLYTIVNIRYHANKNDILIIAFLTISIMFINIRIWLIGKRI